TPFPSTTLFRSVSLPRSGLPCPRARRSGARGSERGQRGRGGRVPRGEAPLHVHRVADREDARSLPGRSGAVAGGFHGGGRAGPPDSRGTAARGVLRMTVVLEAALAFVVV